jgi:hypothetical protein
MDPETVVPRRSRLLSPIGIAVLALVVTLAPLAFVRYSAHPAAAPALSRSVVPTAPAPDVPIPGTPADQCGGGPGCGSASAKPTVDPGLVAFAPFGLTMVNDVGTSIGLRWQLMPATAEDPVVVEQTGGSGAASQYGTAPGTTAYTVTGLNPGSGYCFRVAVVLGAPQVAAATQVWSGSACVRQGSRELVAWTWSGGGNSRA